jgi:hypothetical protein
MVQLGIDDAEIAAGGNGNRLGAGVEGAHDLGHGLDGSQLVEVAGEPLDFGLMDFVTVELAAEFGIQSGHDFAVGHTGSGVKTIQRPFEGRAVVPETRVPGAKMKRHGIDQGAVAIEYVAGKRPVWQDQIHVSLHAGAESMPGRFGDGLGVLGRAGGQQFGTAAALPFDHAGSSGEEFAKNAAGQAFPAFFLLQFAVGAVLGGFPGLGEAGGAEDHGFFSAGIEFEFAFEALGGILHHAGADFEAKVFVFAAEFLQIGFHAGEVFALHLEFVTEVFLVAFQLLFGAKMAHHAHDVEDRADDESADESVERGVGKEGFQEVHGRTIRAPGEKRHPWALKKGLPGGRVVLTLRSFRPEGGNHTLKPFFDRMLAHFTRAKTFVFIVLIALFIGLAWFTTDYDTRGSSMSSACPIRVYGRCYQEQEIRRMVSYFEVSRDLLLIDFALSLFGENRLDRDPTDFVTNLIILREEAKKLGIEPTDEEAKEAIRTSPIFGMQTWIDDDVLVSRVLAPRGLTKGDLVQLGKDYLCWRKLGDLLEVGNDPVPVEIEKTYIRKNQKYTAWLAEFAMDAYKDKATVTDAEIQEFYDQKKKEHEEDATKGLLSDEKRGFTMVTFSPPAGTDKLTNEQKAESKSAFNNRVNELYATLADDETKFSELAKTMAADKSNAFAIKVEEVAPFAEVSPPESLKKQPQMLADLFSGARSTDAGRSVTIPYAQEDGGFLMFKITSIVAPLPLTLEESREQIKTALTAKKSNQLVNEAATAARTKVLDALKAGKKPAEAAVAAGIEMKSLPAFSESEPPTGIDAAPQIAAAAQSTPNGSASDLLPIPPAKGYRFVVVEKTELVESDQAESQKSSLKISASSDYRRALFQAWFQKRQREAEVSRAGSVAPEDDAELKKQAPGAPTPEAPAES